LSDSESFPSVILGYDPGGRDSHGAAVVSRESDGNLTVKVATKSSVAEVFTWFEDQSGTKPFAAGIDTLLSWPTHNEAGWRGIDSYLRETYPLVVKGVISANWLYGAMCLNGMSFAMKLRERWSQVAVRTRQQEVQIRLSNGFLAPLGDQIDTAIPNFKCQRMGCRHQT
jgi:predicted RNase H-like nuclease